MLSCAYEMCYLKRQSQLQLILQTQGGNGSRYWSALDGTHIKIRVPIVDKPRYRTRKVDIATNMLGVCTPDMHFFYVIPSWEILLLKDEFFEMPLVGDMD
ncbi:hypothetical protein Gotur_005126 [Gossypium turneri]